MNAVNSASTDVHEKVAGSPNGASPKKRKNRRSNRLEVAIIGARAVGKTTLYDALLPGLNKAAYGPTNYAEERPEIDVLHDDFELRLKASLDVPGHDSQVFLWKNLVRHARLIIYVVRAHDVMSDDEYALERLRADADCIANFRKRKWWQLHRKSPLILVIGTHADKLPVDTGRDARETARDAFAGHEAIEGFCQALKSTTRSHPRVLLGSLVGPEARAQLVQSIVGAMAT